MSPKYISVKTEYTRVLNGGLDLQFTASVNDNDRSIDWVAFTFIVFNNTVLAQAYYPRLKTNFNVFTESTNYLFDDLPGSNFGIPTSFAPNNNFEPNCLIGFNYHLIGSKNNGNYTRAAYFSTLTQPITQKIVKV